MRIGLAVAKAILAITVLCGCDPNDAERRSSSRQQQVASVSGQLASVELRAWPGMVRVQGSLIADEITSVAARVAGRVVNVHFDLGDTVQENDILVGLDSTEFELKLLQSQSQLSQARAAIGLQEGDKLEDLNPSNSPPVREARAVLDEANQQVRRLETLFSQGAIVATDLETAQSLASVAEARFNSAMNSVREKIAMVEVQSALVALARQELDDTSIKAPFRGIIQNRTIALGMYVQVGQPLMEIAKTDQLRYRASVPERYAQSLAEGQSVQILVGDQVRHARIDRIAPTLDTLSRSLTFEAMVDNSDGSLRAGLFAAADVVIDERAQAIVIEHSSIIRFAGIDKVWRVSEGQVQEAVVRLGRETELGIEVVEGLQPGDQILLNALDGKRGRYVGLTQDSQSLAKDEIEQPAQSQADDNPGQGVSSKQEADSQQPAQAVTEPRNSST